MAMEEINIAIEMINAVKQNKEIIKEIISEVVDVSEDFLPEIDKQIKRLQDYSVDMKDRMIKRFIAKGYSQEESILLSIDTSTAFKKVIKDAGERQQRAKK
jgi:cob(I)alamin adenosyltransferase